MISIRYEVRVQETAGPDDGLLAKTCHTAGEARSEALRYYLTGVYALVWTDRVSVERVDTFIREDRT